MRVLAAASLCVAMVALLPVTAGEREDEEIRLNIETSLSSRQALAGDRLEVAFAEGHATLTGRVATLYRRWQALEATARVRGVVSIDDRIELASPPAPDDRLAAAVRRRFEEIPKIANAKLRVEARSGTVTVEGTVTDARARFTAREAAARIEGVHEVVDRIGTAERPDDRLQKDVEGLLGGSSLRRVPGEIEVAVVEGVVGLEGWVPRLSDRIEAERTALGVNGVKGVDNRLEVRPKPRPDSFLR